MIHALTNIIGKLRTWVTGCQLNVLIASHLALASFGVLGVFFGLRNVFVASYAINFHRKARDAEKFFDWLRHYYFPDHKYTLYAYAITITLFGLIFLAMLVCLLRKERDNAVIRRLFPWIYLADVLAVLYLISLSAMKVGSWSFVLPGIGIWLVITFLPFVLTVKSGILGKVFSPIMLMAIFATEFVVCMVPFITGQALFYNDYFAEIPSYTWVRSSPAGEPKLVDNIQYINANRIWGHLHYDPRESNGEDPACLPEYRLTGTPTKSIREYINVNRDKFYFRHPTGEACFIGTLTENEWRVLSSMPVVDHQLELVEAYGENTRKYTDWERNPPTVEQVDFIERNQFEISQSMAQLEAIFHHHFQFLNPVKDMSLGRPLGEIVSLYGLSFLPIYVVMKYAGEISYQSFLVTVFSSYLAYFVLFIGMLVAVFRDSRYVAIMLLTSLAFVKALGYVTVFIGVNYTPVRHFHDVFVILFFFLYLTKGRSAWLIAAFAAACVGVLLDRFYGSFGILTLLAVLAVRIFVGHGRPIEKWVILLGAPAYALLFWFVGEVVAPNPYVDGFLAGVWGFPVDNMKMGLMLIGVISVNLVLAYLLKEYFDERLYLSLFLVLYTEALLFYWLIIPNNAHLYMVLPWAIFSVASLMRFGLSATVSARAERASVATALVAAVLLSLLGTRLFLASAMDVRKAEKDHKIFDWPFKNARIRSTMDPDLFSGATQVMQRWAPQGGVYVISQFDTLITWLSGKYSLMPHSDLISYLSGPIAHNNVVSILRAKRPNILFVDSCIECSFVPLRPGRESILGINPDLFERSAEKVDRLRRLQNVFMEIKGDYELVERGALISVYRLRRTQGVPNAPIS
jgi:hypothetical protein